MKRRFNSTGRRQIAAKQINISLFSSDEPGGPKSFEADLSGLKELGLPDGGRVYVEPYVTGSSSIMRFDFGTISSLSAPADRQLTELDSGGRILFRVKVVDESNHIGKILAAANALRPVDIESNDDQTRSLLPVESRDLREAIWELDMRAAPRPTLVVSNRIPGLIDRLKTDPLMQGAIVPHAIHEILLKVFDPEQGEFTDDLEWVQDWKNWAREMLGGALEEDLEADVLEEKIDEIIERFHDYAKFVSAIDRLVSVDGPHND